MAAQFVFPPCMLTGYRPIVENIQMGPSSAEFYLSSGKWKGTVHLYLNLNLRPASPVIPLRLEHFIRV